MVHVAVFMDEVMIHRIVWMGLFTFAPGKPVFDIVQAGDGLGRFLSG